MPVEHLLTAIYLVAGFIGFVAGLLVVMGRGRDPLRLIAVSLTCILLITTLMVAESTWSS